MGKKAETAPITRFLTSGLEEDHSSLSENALLGRENGEAKKNWPPGYCGKGVSNRNEIAQVFCVTSGLLVPHSRRPGDHGVTYSVPLGT